MFIVPIPRYTRYNTIQIQLQLQLNKLMLMTYRSCYFHCVVLADYEKISTVWQSSNCSKLFAYFPNALCDVFGWLGSAQECAIKTIM
jgi:hypothetical protein